MSTPERLGLRIRELRTDLGWTQEDLAAELAVPVQNIARWEQGRVEMRVGTLFKIIEALQLDDPGDILQEPKIKAPRPGRPRRA